MNGYLEYIGKLPKRVLKREWSSGSAVTLDELFNLFGSLYGKSNTIDQGFVDWFTKNYMVNLGSDFRLIVENSGTSSKHKVIVESSSVKVDSSLAAAKERLRKMRHPDEVGDIKKETDQENLSSKQSPQEMIANMPKPGTVVLTGDDLEAERVIVTRRETGFVISEEGKAVKAIPTNKEKQALLNAQMSEVSKHKRNNIQVNELYDNVNSKVIVGSDLPMTEKRPRGRPRKTQETQKVNKNFVAYPNLPEKQEISSEHILRADLNEAIRLIKTCKDVVVLKTARLYAYNKGETRLVEELDKRIMELPPF